jgi:hypothetical protein
MRHCVKQGAQDAGSREFERAPKFGLGAPLLLTALMLEIYRGPPSLVG